MERKQIIIAVAIIKNDKGEILMPRRHQPDDLNVHNKWEFPGGGIEFGEDPEQAVVREVKEETGLEVKIIRLLPKIFCNIWEKESSITQVFILCYECKATGGILGSEDEEIGELKYFKIEAINYNDCLPKTKEIIELLNTTN